MSKKLSIIMYHYVRDLKNSRYPNINGLDLDLFKEQIDFLYKNFHVVTMEQVVDASRGKGELPENAVLLTFDDGYIDHFTNVFPVLCNYGMQGSFFIPSRIFLENKLLDSNKLHFILASGEIGNIKTSVLEYLKEYRKEGYDIEPNEILYGKLAEANRWDDEEVIFVKRLLQNYLPEALREKIVHKLFLEYVGIPEEKFVKEVYVNLDQIRCMKKAGMFFGLHGHGHYWLDKLDEEAMKIDINTGLDFFREFIHKDYMVMNYPYGGYNDQVLSHLKSIGCNLGLGVDPRVADLEKENLLTLPRFDTNDFPPKSDRYKGGI